MNALPALTTIANDAIRAQFAGGASAEPAPGLVLPRTRSALANALLRAARAVDPTRPVGPLVPRPDAA
jgi:hypothetical protein